MTRVVILLTLALFGGSAKAQSPEEGVESVISIDDFKDCGLVTRFTPSRLKPECFQNMRNIVIDNDWSILRRNGYAPYNATACTGGQPIRGLFSFFATDGSQYIIMHSSGSMFYSKGDGTCTPITGLNGGLSTTATMSCVQTLSYLWCTDGTDSVFRTNVTSTDVISSAPRGPYIGAFRNRVVISGVPGTLTDVYLSGELDGTDWSLPVVSYSTSPAILKINGVNDGLAVSCLMGEFQNSFLIGRQYDMWALSGYDLRDFSIHRVSEQVGCLDNKSSQEVNNVFYWLSRRGVEAYTGTQIQRASYNIDPTLAVIIAAAGNSQSQLFTTQADWQNGNLTASGPGAPVSSTISPGDIVPSSFSFTDTFSSGTFNNVALYNSVLEISTGSPFQNSGFEYANFSNWTNSNFSNQSVGASLNCNRSYAACSGDCNPAVSTNGIVGHVGTNMRGTVEVYASGGAIIFSSTTASLRAQDCLNTPQIVNTSTNAATQIYLKAYSTDYSSYSLQSSTFPNWSNGFSYGWTTSCTLGGGNKCVILFDVAESTFGAAFSSGQFTSRIFNTGFSTPTVTVIPSSFSVLGATISFTVRSSTSPNNDLWGGFFTAGTNPQRQYVQYGATFTVSASTMVPGINSVFFVAESTAYYITPCVTAAGNTSWGNLTVNGVTNGGSFTFYMSTSGVSCAQAINPTTANWSPVTANSIISVAVASYTAVRVLFSMDVATEVPTINDITVSWNAGASRPPVASAAYKNEYWLFYTTSQAVGAANDHALVFDENQKWQLHDDINAASADIYLNSLYLGDSQASGKVFQFDTGNDDNGNSFTMSFQTPDLDGGDNISLKNFKRMYLVMGAPSPTTLSGSMSCSYSINGSTTAYSLGTVNLTESPEQGGYFVAKMPFQINSPTLGQWISLSCRNTGTVGPLRVYSVRIVYTKNDWP